MEILEGRGESAKAVSSVSKESEAFIREQMANPPDSEVHEAEATGVEMIGIEAKPDGSWSELVVEDGVAEAPELVVINEVTEAPEPIVVAQPETMAAEDRFELVGDSGQFRETLCLDPHAATLLRKALKGRKCADACLFPERQELHAITWPDYQKVIVRPYD